MIKLLLKRVLPGILALALLVLAGLWLWGFIGIKAGLIGPTEVGGLNAVSRHGADAAGGAVEAAKIKMGL